MFWFIFWTIVSDVPIVTLVRSLLLCLFMLFRTNKYNFLIRQHQPRFCNIWIINYVIAVTFSVGFVEQGVLLSCVYLERLRLWLGSSCCCLLRHRCFFLKGVVRFVIDIHMLMCDSTYIIVVANIWFVSKVIWSSKGWPLSLISF